jgi:hypothetical protein
MSRPQLKSLVTGMRGGGRDDAVHLGGIDVEDIRTAHDGDGRVPSARLAVSSCYERALHGEFGRSSMQESFLYMQFAFRNLLMDQVIR